MKKGRERAERTDLDGRGLRFALIVSRFNESVTSKLLAGAEQCLRHYGTWTEAIDVFHCPGAFELPQVANQLAALNRWDAIICLGAVIRGETPHDQYIATEAAHGIQKVALQHNVPVLFGVLTTNSERQALERAGGKHGNKGWDAAEAAIEMAALFKRFKRAKKS